MQQPICYKRRFTIKSEEIAKHGLKIGEKVISFIFTDKKTLVFTGFCKHKYANKIFENFFLDLIEMLNFHFLHMYSLVISNNRSGPDHKCF